MRQATLRVLCAVSLLAFAPAAQAQGLNAGGLRPLPGVDPAETSPVQRLSKDAKAWMAEEQLRQQAEPGDLIELAFEIEQNIGDAVIKIARRERIDTRDIILVVMHDIMTGAAEAVEDQIAHAEGADLEALTARKAVLDAKIAELNKNQTVVSRALIRGQ